MPRSSRNQRNDLLKMMEDSAKVGLLLLRQSVKWDFGSWDRDSRSKCEDSMVVFPSMLLLSDGDGRSLQSPKIVMKAEIEVFRGKAGQTGLRHGSMKARSKTSTGSKGVRTG